MHVLSGIICFQDTMIYMSFFLVMICPLNPNIGNLNAILKMLKQEHSFLREGESTSQQQVFRDLNKAFTSFFKGKSAYPKFKSKKNPKQSFRIQKKTETIFT